jgi:hypothetical protein
MAKIIDMDVVLQIANVLRDGGRIDRAIERGADGALFVTTLNTAAQQVRIPVAHDTTLPQEVAWAEELYSQADAELAR